VRIPAWERENFRLNKGKPRNLFLRCRNLKKNQKAMRVTRNMTNLRKKNQKARNRD
jgi:hypothetical protein